MLGSFRVLLGGSEVPNDGWPTRRAAELVQLLALAEGNRLMRDQAIEALWPELDAEAGAANLRKAAHHARRALGSREAVVLRGGQVFLLPEGEVDTDVAAFEALAAAALGGGDAEKCAEAAAAYTGELLPESRYEDWAQAPRERLRSDYLELLRESAQFERLIELEPTDETAYLELMRRELDAGRRAAAIRWYGRLRTALRRELGVAPSPEAEALYDGCVEKLRVEEPELVGRQGELARVTALLRAGPENASGALAVRGPAGIGKSAFCRAAGRAAEAEGWAVVAATATEGDRPYAPLAAMIESLVSADESIVDRIGEESRSVLGRIASIPARAPSPETAETPETPLTRHKVIGAVRRLLLAARADRDGLMLIVDDAHLADEGTIGVLAQLASPGAGAPLVVVAYRPEPAPASLTGGVARLVRAGRAVELDLAPLTRDEVVALVAGGRFTPRGEETIERIVELGEGNPFLTLELARSAVVGVPALAPTVRDAVVSRFVDLDEETLAALRLLALAADEVDPDAAVSLAGATDEEALAALDAALAAGALVVDAGLYRFRHEIVRQALVEQLPPHRRPAAHLDAAARLERADAAPELIAWHWLEGGEPASASPWLLTAARHAAGLGAYADALTQLDPLLEHDPAHAEGLSLRAEALDVLGDAEAPAAYRRAADAVDGTELADELRAKGAVAQIKLGDPPGGLEALEGVAPTTLEGRIAQALAYAGAAALGFGDPEFGSAKAAEARRLALESGDAGAVAIASWAQAAAAHARGSLRESVRTDLRETHALSSLAVSAFDGQLCITQRLLYGARPYPDVIAFADSLETEAERLGAARGHAFAVTIRGEAKLLAGQLDAAEEDLLAGADLHRRLGAASGESFALQRRAEVQLYRGRRAEASALLDEALAIARESEVGFHLFDRIYGARIVAAADPDAALAALEEAESAVRGPLETCPGCRITLAVPAAIAAARGGDSDRASEWTEASEYLANVVMRLPAWYAALEEVHGHRARAEGNAEDARVHFRAAAEGFRSAGQPLDEARCVALGN